MATKPSSPYDTPPSWATNAAYILGDEAGNPTKVEPPTAQTEDGWRPGERPPAQYQNFWQHSTGLWLQWAEDSIDEIDARFVAGGIAFKAGRSGGLRYLGANAAMVDVYTDWTKQPGQIIGSANVAQCSFDLTPLIPRGQTAEIDRVYVLVNPGAARSGGNRISTKLISQSYGISFASPSRTNTERSTVEDDGTTDLQWIEHDFTGAPITVADTTWQLEVTCGADAGSNSDTIYAVAVQVAALGLTII